MTLEIRLATRKDIPELCNLMEQLSGSEMTLEQMENRLQFVESSPFDTLYVCEENNKILGLLGFRIRENLETVTKYGEISALVVDSSVQRKGVGKYLMEFAEQIATKEGCVGTWLVSGLGRIEQAHRFYKEIGYEVTGYRFVKRI